MSLATRPAASGSRRANGFSSLRSILAVGIVQALTPIVKAQPAFQKAITALEDKMLPEPPTGASIWMYLGTAIALVLSGGIFAGLTIALIGQDELNLQVIASSGEGSERTNAARVLRLLKRGKHWVLVSLLLSNTITNEALPVVLDRSIGGGWLAVAGSTALIVIFGEIVPQSVCVRFGLPIGARMAPLVLCLMLLLSPIAWPIAKLLDHILGEDHGTTYKKAGLKQFITFHKLLGARDERLDDDEVTIITATLDLKNKPVSCVMTPIASVFTLSSDTILDKRKVDAIFASGLSRIPIHAPDKPTDFVGVLLVKMLITYDPEDAYEVRWFPLTTPFELRPDISCLSILNVFKQGNTHLLIVSEFPGEDHGVVGIVTLEDILEELIGGEIIDESDVFVDVAKGIRRKPRPAMILQHRLSC